MDASELFDYMNEAGDLTDLGGMAIFCDGCGDGLAPGENCEACELSQLYLVTRSIVRVLFYTALAAVAGLSTALLYAWINPHA